jgi:pimeloyl-ACP methyl ester carboxylesterase
MLADSDFNDVTRGGQTWRCADSGQGPVVMLIHGFPDTPQSYAGIAQALNDAGYRTIVPYLRGYHPSTLVPGRPYDAFSKPEVLEASIDY